MRTLLIAAALASLAVPALAQSPIRERLAKAGQGELVAGDGPTYRAITGSGEVLLLQVAGDGRATLRASTKTDPQSFSNRQLDALDAALAQAGYNADQPLTAQACKSEAQFIFETNIEGRYRYGLGCEGDALSKALAILRGR
ncbi:MAG TPA: hypothetical protein VFN88_14065 [Caulobacteraceae bacterium]|nr:hypothetical protein [Caulobacteraceae bacterium]